MLFAVLGAVVVFAYFATFSRPLTTVILVRHAEKKIEPNNADPDLTPLGESRAQELVRMFGDAGINAIYATQFRRTQETVKPLADRLALPILTVDSKQTQELVRQILTDHRGQTVLVSGHSNTVPEIITALGGPKVQEIPDSDYDNLFVVTCYRFGKAKVVRLKYGAGGQTGTGNPTMTP